MDKINYAPNYLIYDLLKSDSFRESNNEKYVNLKGTLVNTVNLKLPMLAKTRVAKQILTCIYYTQLQQPQKSEDILGMAPENH